MSMATQQGDKITMRAAAATDLSADSNIGLAAATDANGDAVLAGAAGADFMGVILDGGRNAGDNVTIGITGSFLCKAGAAINEGDKLTIEAGGRWIPASDAGDKLCGIAVQAAADLDLFHVIIVHGESDGAA